jgi:release factor glutamine methyltransferase
MRGLIAGLRKIAFRVRHARLAGRFTRPDACSCLGFELVVAPGVLHPNYFPSSTFLARALAGLDLRDRKVLDIGTGSGILALVAARNGADLTAVDINATAVECSRANFARNGAMNNARVLRSDVFDALTASDRFDLIVSNPPFYDRAARSDADRAFATGPDNDFFRRLADGLDSRLVPGGSLILVHSSDAAWEPIESLFRDAGFTSTIVDRRRRVFETLTVYEVSRTQRT